MASSSRFAMKKPGPGGGGTYSSLLSAPTSGADPGSPRGDAGGAVLARGETRGGLAAFMPAAFGLGGFGRYAPVPLESDAPDPRADTGAGGPGRTPAHSETSRADLGNAGSADPGPSAAEKRRVLPGSLAADPAKADGFLRGFLGEGDPGSAPAQALSILDPKFYIENYDAVKETLEQLQSQQEPVTLQGLGAEFRLRSRQLSVITDQLATQVMSHHEEMVQGMQLVGEMEKDLRTLTIISKNARRHLSRAMEEVSNDLVVAASVQRKRFLTSMIPLLLRMQQVAELKRRLEETGRQGDFAKALRMCSEVLVQIEQNNYLSAIYDMNRSIEEWLTRIVEEVDSLLFEVCRSFHPTAYARVVDAYAVMDDAATLAEKAQNFFAQSVVTETFDALNKFLDEAGEADDPKKTKMSYNELCLQVPESVFRACLQRTLEVLFEILCSHYKMMLWQHPMAMDISSGSSAGLVSMPPPRQDPASSEDPGKEGTGLRHRRSGSAPIELQNPLLEPCAGDTGDAQSERSRTVQDASPAPPMNAVDPQRALQDSGAQPALEERLPAAAARGNGDGEAGADGTLLTRRTSSRGSAAVVAEADDVLASSNRVAREHRRHELQRGSSDKERRGAGGYANGSLDFDDAAVLDSLRALRASQAQEVQLDAHTNGAAGGSKAQGTAGPNGAGGVRVPALPPPPSPGNVALDAIKASKSSGDFPSPGGSRELGPSASTGSTGSPSLRGPGRRSLRRDGSEKDEKLGDIPPKVARRMRADTTAVVRKALEKGRKAVWELAARRVSSLISSDALCSGSSQQFLQSLEWVDRFILVGEAFTQSEAVGLRAKVTKQSERYFKFFHLQNLEVLRMIIERESWQRLPPSALSSLTLTGLIGSPQSFLSPPSGSTLAMSAGAGSFSLPPSAATLGQQAQAQAASQPGRQPDLLAMGGSKSYEKGWSFLEWMERGNPFSQQAPPGLTLPPKLGSSSIVAPPAPATASGPVLGALGGPSLAPARIVEEPAAAPAGRPRSTSGSLAELGPSGALAQVRQLRAQNGRDSEDEEDSEELLADFIDDDDDSPAAGAKAAAGAKPKAGRNSVRSGKGPDARTKPGRTGSGGAGGLHSSPVQRRGLRGHLTPPGARGVGAPVGVSVLGLGLALTGASLSLIRLMDRYARLMQILKPISVDIFSGLCQLFELYFLSIFRMFGSRDSLLNFRHSADPFQPELTVKLRSTLARISQALEQQQQLLLKTRPGASAAAAVGSAVLGEAMSALGSLGNGLDSAGALAFGTSSLSSFASAGGPSSTTSQLLSASNMYGLRERCVAMESLVWLADVLEESRQRLQVLLPSSALPTVDSFFVRTLDAVPDLWDHVLRTLTRRLINVSAFPDRIAACSWEIKQQLGTQHNQYVEAMLTEFQMFMHKLAQSGTPAQVQGELMEHGVELLGIALVEGYARVKRCSNEGRALMSLDLQVLSNGLQQLTGAVPEMQLAENYVKAFYLPETEFLYWARTHPEYSKAQVVALINLVATVNGWKRKARVDLIERIETGDYS